MATAKRTLHRLELANARFFGRQNELNILEDALDRVTTIMMKKKKKQKQQEEEQDGTKKVFSSAEMVIVEGFSGSGKTRLVQTFRTRFVREQAYYCSGKCDSSRKKEPFCVVKQAFQELCRELLAAANSTNATTAENDDDGNDENKRTAQRVIWNVRTALGAQAGILANAIPCLAEILGENTGGTKPHSTAAEVNQWSHTSGRARHQLHFLCRVFVRAITEIKPVVLFCDDLHWIDGSSLQILSSLLTDPQMNQLLVIGSFRSNEFSSHLQLAGTLQNIESKTGRKLVRIALQDLSAVELNMFVARVLKLSPDETVELASVVYQKTLGNVLFSLQLLDELVQRGLLRYSFPQLRWVWSSSHEIRLGTDISENVVDLIAGKIRGLPRDEQTCLKVSSCISSPISVPFLQTLLQRMSLCLDNSDCPTLLERIEAQGFLTRVGNKTDSIKYKFAHDRIQQATYQLIPEGKARDLLHYNIGNVLLKMMHECLGAKERDDLAFAAAHQLNQGNSCISNDSELIELVKMNLWVGKRAMAVCAFALASQYLSNGISLMRRLVRPWDMHRDLQLALHQNLAEVLWSTGSARESVQMAKKVEQRARTADERLAATMTLAQALGAQEKHGEAVAVELRELRALRIIPAAFRKINAITLLFKLRKRLKRVSQIDIAQLPRCENAKVISALKFLFFTINHSGFAGDDALQLLAITMSVNLTLKYGVHEVAVGAFAQIGGIINLIFGDAKEGYRLAMMTASLMDRLAISSANASVVIYGYIYPWNAPLTDTLAPLLKAYNDGMRAGDIELSLICFTTYILNGYMAGLKLTSLLDDARTHFEVSNDYEIRSVMPVVRVVRQMLSNLVGHAEDAFTLTGEAMDEDRFLSTNKSAIAAFNFYLYKAQVCYYYGNPRMAAQCLLLAKQNDRTATAFSEKSSLLSFTAFTKLELAFKAVEEGIGQRKHKREARRSIRAFRRVVSRGSEGKGINLSHKLLLLDAGYMALGCPVSDTQLVRRPSRIFEGKIPRQEDTSWHETTVGKVRREFDRAITLASRAGFRQDAALGNQLAGRFCQRHDPSWASPYLSRCIELYRDWGAKGVARSLQQRCAIQNVQLGKLTRLQSTNHLGLARHPKRFERFPQTRRMTIASNTESLTHNDDEMSDFWAGSTTELAVLRQDPKPERTLVLHSSAPSSLHI